MGYATGFKIGSMANTDIGDLLVSRDVFSEGGLWGWGNDYYGMLGDSTSTSKSSPVQTITGGSNWKQVSAGRFQTAAIKTDGTLWTWGYNLFGVLGDNTTTDRSSPVQTIAGGSNWKQVDMFRDTQTFGNATTAAIKTDGTLWLWGSNNTGQLGDNTTTNKSSPIQTIAGGTNWKQVSCGYTTAAIKTDGTLWLWGDNSNGQLGDNTTSAKYSPIQTIAGGTNWKQVSTGGSTTAAIMTDGSLWVWGSNSVGQLGDSTTTDKSSPIQTITGGTNWKQVSCRGCTAAIKTDGSLWTWGYNSGGILGDGTITNRSSPVQTVAGGNNWKQVSSTAGPYQTAAIKADGTLWAWGSNVGGALGDNTMTHRSSPVQTIAGGTNWKQVSCGEAFTFAIKDDM